MQKVFASLVFFLLLCSFAFIEGQGDFGTQSFGGGRWGGGHGGGMWRRCPYGYRAQGRCRREYDCGFGTRAFCYRRGGSWYGTCCARRGWYDRWDNNDWNYQG